VSLRSAWARLSAVCALLCLLSSGTVLAQSGTSAIYGKVADPQGGVLPGVTVTVTNTATGQTRSSVTDATGDYQILAVPPGTYSVKVELQGFRTAVRDNVVLSVDARTKMDVPMELGSMTETIEVTGNVSPLNTTDASLGNVITGNQVRALPLEANNVVGLLSLQAGAVYLPNASNVDSRSGAVSGGRADQSNVTLDGVDVNDPQFSTAYTSGLRVTQESLQEFRVSTSNYGAESGRSSAAQVSLVTRSGTNAFHGSGYYVMRDTKTSSNEYFLKLSQLSAGEVSKTPKLDKKIYGGAFGGPVMKDKFFFFGNFEGLREESESPVTRAVPSDSMRDGVLIYQCAVPGACPATSVAGFTARHAVPAGSYGLTPGELKAIDPLGLGPSQPASTHFRQYPSPNDPGRDGYNIMGYRFAAPIENSFDTYIGRFDFRATGNNTFFGRFNIQDDAVATAPQFPGQASNTTREIKSKGGAFGWDSVFGSNAVNTFRYGYTLIKEDTIGLQQESRNSFRFLDDFEALTSTNGREPATHNIVNDFNWVKGSHSWKFGTNIRYTRIPRYTNANSFNAGTANGSWVDGVGRTYMPGADCPEPSTDGCNAVPAVASGGQAVYADTLIDILGIISQTDGNYNYNKDGSVLPEGEATYRNFASDEYEFYAQDSWKLGSQLTFTAGVRYSIYSPPYEVTGLQVQPSINLGDWFDQRAALMAAGRSTSELDLIEFDLAGPKNNKPGLYAWDKNNFAPRLALAWTPHFESGVGGWLTGKDKMVVRGGYSMVYDRVGHSLATQYDAVGSFGLSTQLSSDINANNEDNPDIRFTDISTLPNTVPTAPAGGFPQTPPPFSGQITSALDQSIVTPYAHTWNVVVGRELGGDYSLEVAYVGRVGRNQMVRRDFAMPANLKDPKSGDSYFQAVRKLIDASKGIPRSAGASAYFGIPSIPYWENLFPDAAGFLPGLSATQAMARSFNRAAPDYTTALWNADEFCFPACSTLGEFAFFTQQYDSLAVMSSTGRSEYNAMQVSLRKRWSKGYQFDVNYTLAHGKDHSSQVERGSFFTPFDNGGYTGFLLNSWEPDLHYANSDYDIRHQININWITDLPFGRGRAIGSDVPGFVNAIIGEWSVAGLFRLTSGLPFNIFNCRSCWPTNWNLQGNASLVTPGRLPESGAFKDVVDGYPALFEDPEDALTYFRRSYPGEVGIRNEMRGDGFFTVDLSVSKAWTMPWSNDQKLRFRWDTFNLTNTPRFDTGATDTFPDIATTFGRYNGTLATCDGGAGRCMQFSARYEF
jgi:hypothetical protein